MLKRIRVIRRRMFAALRVVQVVRVLRDVWRASFNLVWLAYIWTVAHVHFHFRAVADISPWSIVRVIAINDDTNEFFTISSRVFDPRSWDACLPEDDGDEDVEEEEEDEEDEPTTNPSWRVEVRYVHTTKFGRPTKYRMVLRQGDVCTFPPKPPGLGRAQTGRAMVLGVVHADLVPRDDTDATHIDITDRIKKYMGPGKDFHGLDIRPLDVFPYDDPEILVQRFAGIRLVTMTYTSIFVPFDGTTSFTSVLFKKA